MYILFATFAEAQRLWLSHVTCALGPVVELVMTS